MTDKRNKKGRKVDYIFVVLTYRVEKDLNEFLLSINSVIQKSYKVIIVNSFYDEVSKKNIENIAKLNNCDFINVENKGYSYGNNMGIDFAQKHYDYDFLIVSNPDILIKKFDINNKKCTELGIYGAKIITLNGKNQNPFRPVYFEFGEWVTYIGYKYDLRLLIWFNVIINKVLRTIFYIGNKKNLKKVYSVHGSFVIFTKGVIDKLAPIYYEEMFLFCEEDYLAYRMRNEKVPIYYMKDIEVLHKEDGSVGISNVSIWEKSKESYIKYYEKKRELRKGK